MNENMAPQSHGEASHRDIITAAARTIADAALRLIEADPHQFSKRPCQTCAAVSSLVGRPFGCVAKATVNFGRPE